MENNFRNINRLIEYFNWQVKSPKRASQPNDSKQSDDKNPQKRSRDQVWPEWEALFQEKPKSYQAEHIACWGIQPNALSTTYIALTGQDYSRVDGLLILFHHNT